MSDLEKSYRTWKISEQASFYFFFFLKERIWLIIERNVEDFEKKLILQELHSWLSFLLEKRKLSFLFLFLCFIFGNGIIGDKEIEWMPIFIFFFIAKSRIVRYNSLQMDERVFYCHFFVFDWFFVLSFLNKGKYSYLMKKNQIATSD